MRVNEVLQAWKDEGKPGSWNDFQKQYKLRRLEEKESLDELKNLLAEVEANEDDGTDDTLELGEFPAETVENKGDEPVEETVVEATPVVEKTESPKAPKPATGKKRGRKGSAVKNAQAMFHANYSKLVSGELNRSQMIELMVSQGISKNTAIVQYAIQKKAAQSQS